MICQSCKRRPATMTADILVGGELKKLRLCGLCAHRFQMRENWEAGTRSTPGGKVYFTQDLNLPVPEGTEELVFTAITRRGQQVMEWAERESQNIGLSGIASTAILMALLIEEGSATQDILRDMGVDVDRAFQAMHESLKKPAYEAWRNEVVDARELLSRAQSKAAEFGDKVVEPEHIMLALLEGERTLVIEVLLWMGVNIEELKARLLYYLEGQRMEATMRRPRPVFREMTPMDELVSAASAGGGEGDESLFSRGAAGPGAGAAGGYLGRDLVREAGESGFDASVGREEVVERVIGVLCRRNRNNPLLVGDAGVGKTYVVEALAQRVARGEVPAALKEVAIAELDTVSLIEGASLQGELEKRVKRMVADMSSRPGGFILYIPYVQRLLGEEGRAAGIGLGTILQSMLDNPRLWCIASTTFKHYENLVAADETLSEVFEKIPVEELSPEGTLQLLTQLRPHYESFHNVRISDEALDAAVNLSSRYLTGQRLPDKAVDLIDEAAARLTAERAGGSEPVVSAETVAEVITTATGIPVKTLLREEADRLLHMEEELARRVIGQARAIKVVAEIIRRSRAGLSDQKRPIGTFLFMGSTGVGKTEVARSLAEFLFGDERAMVRLDMSEFSEKHSVAKLIGSPPGYVGYEEGGQLTSAVREKPYTVVLLDEIEKAHPAIFNLLLQLMDEGRLTDSRGETVNFRNTIVIMTSNIAGEMINRLPLSDDQDGGGLRPQDLEGIMDDIKGYFPVEFINRIDEVVVFNPLRMQEIEKIVDLKIASLSRQLSAKGIALELGEDARELLARKGFSREFGARYLQRTIQKEVSNPLSDLLLKGELKRGDSVLVGAADGELTFGLKGPAPSQGPQAP